MKGFLSILLLFVALLAVTTAFRDTSKKPKGGNGVPTFPGQGPFNPKPTWPQGYPQSHRFRRSPQCTCTKDKNEENKKGGQIKIYAQKEGGKSTYEVNIGHKIYENEHGSISVDAGISKNPDQKQQKNIGITGSFNFKG